MTMTGRITVDIVYHDVSESSVKVTDIEATESHDSGKVAVISGTHSSSTHTIQRNNTGYTDASGSPVSFSTITRVALKASRPMTLSDNGNAIVIRSTNNLVAFSHIESSNNLTLTPLYTSGTASYTVFLYGT